MYQMKKSKEEILSDLESRLISQTNITNTDPGSVAKTFLEVLSEEFYDFYNELELSVTMNFVSTAFGRYLDMIGLLLNCKRNIDETDENYRSRITNQVYVIAGGNLTAIRLKVLTIPGVRDVIFKEYTHGAGSFTCYVIGTDIETSRSVLNAAQAAVDEAKSYGIYGEVKIPVLIPVKLMVRLVFSSDTGIAEKDTIRQGVAQGIRRYIDGLQLGETLVINEIVQQVMDVSTKMKDVDIYGLYIDGINRYISNATVRWDEKFALDTLDIT